MIEKMIQNDVLQEIDWDQITNKENIGEVYLKSSEGFDPGNKYCVPYTFGTVGILYNKELVDEDAVIDSWDVLWDETYKNDIIMQDSVIEEDVELSHLVFDKEVDITKGRKLIGQESYPLAISKGTKI